MDLSKLIEMKNQLPDNKPLEVKNYKEMCELLGEEKKCSSSKTAQLKEWERYFDWTNKGHLFLINKIYNKPKEKLENKIMLVDVEQINKNIQKENGYLILKNYSDFCRYLDIPIKKGSSKIAQLKKLSLYLDYEKAKNSNELIIKKAFYPISDFEQKHSQFKIPYKYRHYQGIYKIVSNTQLYIGSTKDLYDRYHQHLTTIPPKHKQKKSTWKMLNEENAIFEIIEFFDGDEKELRNKEREYIKNYIKQQKENPALYPLKLINIDWTSIPPLILSTVSLRVNIQDKEKAMEILKNNGIKVYDFSRKRTDTPVERIEKKEVKKDEEINKNDI